MITYHDKSYICSLDLGFELIRGKWKAVILCHLADGPKRFLELQRITKGISQKVLNEALRQLEEEDLRQMARGAGFRPAVRDNGYNLLRVLD